MTAWAPGDKAIYYCKFNRALRLRGKVPCEIVTVNRLKVRIKLEDGKMINVEPYHLEKVK